MRCHASAVSPVQWGLVLCSHSRRLKVCTIASPADSASCSTQRIPVSACWAIGSAESVPIRASIVPKSPPAGNRGRAASCGGLSAALAPSMLWVAVSTQSSISGSPSLRVDPGDRPVAGHLAVHVHEIGYGRGHQCREDFDRLLPTVVMRVVAVNLGEDANAFPD